MALRADASNGAASGGLSMSSIRWPGTCGGGTFGDGVMTGALTLTMVPLRVRTATRQPFGPGQAAPPSSSGRLSPCFPTWLSVCHGVEGGCQKTSTIGRVPHPCDGVPESTSEEEDEAFAVNALMVQWCTTGARACEGEDSGGDGGGGSGSSGECDGGSGNGCGGRRGGHLTSGGAAGAATAGILQRCASEREHAAPVVCAPTVHTDERPTPLCPTQDQQASKTHQNTH